MNLQLTFDEVLTHKDKFLAYHNSNPEVYTALEEMTQQLIIRGRTRIGIGFLCEVLRWNHLMKTNDPNSDFKINNNYRAHYARLLIAHHPDWAEFFELRQIRSE